MKYDNDRLAGIYKITNKTTGKFYIGSANYIKQRTGVHKHTLRRNRHDNNYLQNAWNKYGEDDFIFEVLEVTENSINKLIEAEQKWIDYTQCYKRNIGYNLRIIANSNTGISNSLKGRKLSEETKRKISEGNKGKIVSAETRKRLSDWQKGIAPTWATEKAAIVNRDTVRWPCWEGSLCKCQKCKDTRAEYMRSRRKNVRGIVTGIING